MTDQAEAPKRGVTDDPLVWIDCEVSLLVFFLSIHSFLVSGFLCPSQGLLVWLPSTHTQV